MHSTKNKYFVVKLITHGAAQTRVNVMFEILEDYMIGVKV